MIQTQLLRLEPPYNIICSKGNFAYHIATLIVVEEKEQDNNPSSTIKVAKSYPVVDYGDGSPEGDVWMHSEVNSCRVVRRETENTRYKSISLAWFSNLLKFNQGADIIKVDDNYYPLTPAVLNFCLNRFMINVSNPGLTLAEYEVELTFNDSNENETIIESKGGYLYFRSYIPRDLGIDDAEDSAMQEIISWWEDYVAILRPGMPKDQYLGVVFNTQNETKKEFVTTLNSKIRTV